jgi:hypothetical protein
MADLLNASELPTGFTYPPQFVRVVQLGLINLEPWWIMEGKLLRDRAEGLKERYPTRRLVPFARRQDNDDVACWDVDGDRIVVVHDFAAAGWEQRTEFESFDEWLRAAMEDLIAFE